MHLWYSKNLFQLKNENQKINEIKQVIAIVVIRIFDHSKEIIEFEKSKNKIK